jgi:hypothetical protein
VTPRSAADGHHAGIRRIRASRSSRHRACAALRAALARRSGARERERAAMYLKSLRHLGGAAVALPVTMKKSIASKLTLRTETIRLLADDVLGRVAGGNEPIENGFIMKDSIIIRTGGIVRAPTEGCR